MDYKEKYLRWLEEMWELHNGITREEKRKEEVLKIFEGLGEIAGRRVEAPYFVPWEPTGRWGRDRRPPEAP
jgi:hypothetical protein